MRDVQFKFKINLIFCMTRKSLTFFIRDFCLYVLPWTFVSPDKLGLTQLYHYGVRDMLFSQINFTPRAQYAILRNLKIPDGIGEKKSWVKNRRTGWKGRKFRGKAISRRCSNKPLVQREVGVVGRRGGWWREITWGTQGWRWGHKMKK